MLRKNTSLSDRAIREKCLDRDTPIPVAKYSGVVKPTSGAIVSSVRPAKEFRAPPRLIPNIIAENAVTAGGKIRYQQSDMLEKQLLNRAKSSKKNFGQLAGRVQNRGSLMQDLSIGGVRDMSKDMPFNLTRSDPKKEGNNPFATTVREPIDRILARMTGVPKETDTMALAGAIETIEEVAVPTLESKALLAQMAAYREQSPYFAQTRVQTKLRGQPRGGAQIQQLVDPQISPEDLKRAGPQTVKGVAAEQPFDFGDQNMMMAGRR